MACKTDVSSSQAARKHSAPAIEHPSSSDPHFRLPRRSVYTIMEKYRPKTYTSRYPRWMIGKPLLIASSALASLGDAMFGYSQGSIAANQVQPSFIKRMFGKDVTLAQVQADQTGVDPFVLAITVSCLNITALFASLASAYVCDILGRRMSVRIGAAFYLVAAFFQIFAPDLAVLIVGRSIQGIGVGMLSMTVPILQCEMAPGHARGLFVSIEYICLNLGYALSAWVGYGFFFAMPSEIAWRGPYIIQAALAVILLSWTFILPETPRWLIKNGFREEGLTVLADLHGTGDISDIKIQASFDEIVATVEYEEKFGEAPWLQLFKAYPRRCLVGITCQLFAQFNGINAILYYLPENFTRAGFSVAKALLYSGAAALLYCAGTIPAMIWIDKCGRRPFLLVGSTALIVCLAAIGALQFHSTSISNPLDRMPTANGIFAVICVYLFFYGATWGPAPWLLGAEVFPLRARAKGMALSTVTNWLCNFVIAFITPPLFASINGGYYFVLLGFCAISGVVVYFFYPETAHLTLEQLGAVFGDGDDARPAIAAYASRSEITLHPSIAPSTDTNKFKRSRSGGLAAANESAGRSTDEVLRAPLMHTSHSTLHTVPLNGTQNNST